MARLCCPRAHLRSCHLRSFPRPPNPPRLPPSLPKPSPPASLPACQGYNGSQLWDTAFAVQAIISTGLGDEFGPCLKKAHQYIDKSQASRANLDNPRICWQPAAGWGRAVSLPSVRLTPAAAPILSSPQVRKEAQQPLEKYYRHISKGAWPFSTQDHGWPISDCSSEGLKACLFGIPGCTAPSALGAPWRCPGFRQLPLSRPCGPAQYSNQLGPPGPLAPPSDE